jgi:hypothetical protein
MAILSVWQAILNRIEAKVGNDAVAYFDEAPMNSAAGTAPPFPLILLHDEGSVPQHTLELETIEAGQLRVEVYASAESLEPVVRKILFGAGAYNARDGLDGCEDALSITGMTVLQVKRAGIQRFQEGARDGSAKNVYRCTINYTYEAQLTA